MSDSGLWGTADDYEGGIARIEGQTRIFAQHYNPHALALYSLVGLVTGGYMVFRKGGWWKRSFGVPLIVAGALGWTVTVPRGATAGLLVGLMAVVTRVFMGQSGRSGRMTAFSSIAVAAIAMACISVPWNDLFSLFFVSQTDAGVESRVEAATRGIKQILRNPVFGASSAEISAQLAAHQIAIYHAVVGGIPLGVCSLLFMCLAAFPTFVPNQNADRYSTHLSSEQSDIQPVDLNLAIVIGWLVLGMGLTNNFASPILYWTSWGIAVIGWAAQGKNRAAADNHVHGQESTAGATRRRESLA